MPCALLLFPFLHSGVPPYADECKNEKSTYLFRPLPACRDFLDTLKQDRRWRSCFLFFGILASVRFEILGNLSFKLTCIVSVFLFQICKSFASRFGLKKRNSAVFCDILRGVNVHLVKYTGGAEKSLGEGVSLVFRSWLSSDLFNGCVFRIHLNVNQKYVSELVCYGITRHNRVVQIVIHYYPFFSVVE